jgi:hypothetical protein
MKKSRQHCGPSSGKILRRTGAGTSGLSFEEDTMIRRTLRIAIGTTAAIAFVVGVSAFAAPHAAFRNCICPDIYAPVKCSNGVTYPNGCVAACQHAKDCVPTGDI